MMRFALAALLLLVALDARAEERIVAFDSAISIQPDGSMFVAETIRVVAEGGRIKRGIFRDFPTDYRDRHGNRVRVAFEPTSVTRDGANEPWFTERRSNGVRVYIGDRNVSVAPGEHTYVVRYRTTRQLGFFERHDELYWNVTGNGWIFPIDAVSADVALPTAVPKERLVLEGWTGLAGSTTRAVTVELRDGGGRIRATRALGPEEGLTFALTFPKGTIAEPTTAQRLRWWASDNRGMLVAVAGFLVLWGWYLWRWWRYGRDPAPGVVIPEYESPDGLPPSLLRYVRDMRYDARTFTSDLMHLAERGALRIVQKKKFSIRKLGEPDPANRIAVAFMALMFAKSDTLLLDDEAYAVLGPSKAKHKEAVVAANDGRWFHRNGWSLAIGIVASAVATIAGFVLQGDPGVGIGGIFLAALLSVAAAFTVAQLRRMLRSAGWRRIGRAILALVGIAGCAFLGLMLAILTGTVMFAVVAGMALTNALFAALLPAYTPAGRRLVDRIEGFTRYLAVAEKDDLARERAPPLTGERFAQFLPYAHALDVEQAWADKLVAAVGVAAAAEATRQAVGRWYDTDRGTSFSPDSFASSVGSALGGAISSSSTPPGSSSGGGYSGGGGGGYSGGGGGSSGGGGGGGGGGGW